MHKNFISSWSCLADEDGEAAELWEAQWDYPIDDQVESLLASGHGKWIRNI